MKIIYIKRYVIPFILILLGNITLAQTFNVSTSVFDLEKIDRHKGWGLYSGFTNSNGNYVVKIGKPSCNVSASGVGDIGTVKYTYYGVGYDFEELEFDQSLNYINKTTKSFPTTIKTLLYEPLYGNKFWPQLGTTWLKRYITNDFVGRKTVMPIIEFTGYKIANYTVGGQATANHPKFGAKSCGELIELKKIDAVKMKENKGERWFAIDHVALPGGGVVLFSTDGVVKDQPDKGHYVAKKFDEDLNELARTVLSFDFKAILSILPVDKANGEKDFVVIAQATDFKYSAGSKIEKPDFTEIIYLDGNTLEVKNRKSITLKYTNWYAENTATDSNGNIYIYGTTRDNNNDYVKGRGVLPINSNLPNANITNTPNDQPNFQIVCIDALGNIKYITAVDSKQSLSVSEIIAGTPKKANQEIIFNTYEFKKELYFTSKYLIIAGQQFVGTKGGVDKGNLFLSVFDLQTGNLLKYFIKPETTYAGYNLIFNNDKSHVYWATYDLEEHNKLDGEQGTMKYKSFDNFPGADLYLNKIDLNNITATNFEHLGKDQWAVNFNAPIIVSEEKSDDIIFAGRTLAKKAKDSELILVKVKK
jgi:hypothetical protein